MKRLLSAALALVLALTLALPALAWETSPEKYASFDEYLAFYRAQEDPETQSLVRFLDTYLAGRPDEVVAFDPHAYFEANIASDAGVNIENWFFDQLPSYTEAHFRAEMMDIWLTGLYRAELNALTDTDPAMWKLCLSPSSARGQEISLERCLAYIAMTEEQYAAMAKWCARFQLEHSDEWAAFDPDAYYLANGQETEVPDKIAWGGEAGFADYMRFLWLRKLYKVYDKNRVAEEMAARYPEEYAAFDADAWFPGTIALAPGGHTKASYMAAAGFTTEEEFRLAMFGDWAAYSAKMPRNIAVTVDGQPIRGWPAGGNVAYPYPEHGRILVTTTALEEPLGMTVERDEESRTLTCTRGDRSVTFTDGELAYTVTSGGKTQTLLLDVPPKTYYEADGPFYVPLRALTEALGYAVEWKNPFRIADVTTHWEDG